MYEEGRCAAVLWGGCQAIQGGGLGIGECQFAGQLGLLYVIARGVPQSYEEAHRLWSLAAEQGDSAAQCCIRTLYEGGWGVRKSKSTAREWY